MLESTFLIARGQTLNTDLSRYEVSDKVYYSFLTFSWAMIADIDIDSEVLRCLGSARIDIWAALCGLRMRRYKGRLSYLPLDGTNSPMPSLDDPVPSNWKVIEDDIIMLWASHVTHAGESSYNSPPSRYVILLLSCYFHSHQHLIWSDTVGWVVEYFKSC